MLYHFVVGFIYWQYSADDEFEIIIKYLSFNKPVVVIIEDSNWNIINNFSIQFEPTKKCLIFILKKE